MVYFGMSKEALTAERHQTLRMALLYHGDSSLSAELRHKVKKTNCEEHHHPTITVQGTK